ncbi:MAG: c-type cytochrome, partial [Steroidobacteraceae bacterium]
MSLQNSRLSKVFSVALGLVAVVVVALFGLDRIVASRTPDPPVSAAAGYSKNVATRVDASAPGAVAGNENSGGAISGHTDTGTDTGRVAAMPKNGIELFEQSCSSCHGQGIAGAPRIGDKAAWRPRLVKGKATLYVHALRGFTGSAGIMPAKGGRTDAPDPLVERAVDYMVQR